MKACGRDFNSFLQIKAGNKVAGLRRALSLEWPLSRLGITECLGKIGRVLAQQKPERHLSRAIGLRHSLEINVGILDRGAATGPINLPPPRLRRFRPVLHDNGKIVIADH